MMSNSPLVNYTKISPNKNSPRNHKIDTITIHCVVGQLSVESLGALFSQTSKKASSNYGIGPDGRIGLYVEEKDRSWCSSNADNDNRAITIECASDKTSPYAVNDKVMNSLIKLLVDICKRNGIKELKWKADKSLIGQVDKQNMTVHRWFAAKSCPGDYLYSRHGEIASNVNKILRGNEHVYTANTKLTPEQFISTIAPIVMKYHDKYGFGFSSIVIAQACLESGYGTSNKVINPATGAYRHNYFGLKYRPGRIFVNNGYFTESGSEQNADGSYTPGKFDWYKFPSMDAGVEGYFQFIKNGPYKNAVLAKTPEEYIVELKKANYASSLDYVSKITNVVSTRKLTQYDDKKPVIYTEPKGTYWVGYLVADLKIGTKGKIVKFAQKLLNGVGLKVKEDGLYGENTAKAVSDFQSKNSLAVTGEIDAKTWLKLTASNGIHT